MAIDLPDGWGRDLWERDVSAVVAGRMPSKRYLAIRYAVTRFAIRLSRIVGGIVLAVLAIWLISFSVETLSEPFASLSPLGLIGALIAGLIGLALLVVAFGVAFGEGESRAEHDARIEGTIRAAVEREMPPPSRQAPG
ncbi:MAG: hypothetical protein ACREXU_14320 [Gammaproteobacteria bacterium]